MGLIDDQSVVAFEIGIALHLRQQDAIGHQTDMGIVTGTLMKTHLVTHRLPQRAMQLLGNTVCHTPRGDPPWLGVPNHSDHPAPQLQADLR